MQRSHTSHPLHHSDNTRGGYLVLLVLVSASILIIIMVGLTGFVVTHDELNEDREQQEKALHIAEAGLEYYNWFLAHNPGDLTDGTGNSGPYVHDYKDPEGGTIGKFSLEITGDFECDSLRAIDVSSTGWTLEDPSQKRTVSGRYARPSVAEYSYILDTNAWFETGSILGPVHANGGVRMDSNNQSEVASTKRTWRCTESFGCKPERTEDGVFGSGNSALWTYPVTPIDFNGLTRDINTMKSSAKSDGVYLNPFGGAPGKRGYHLVFQGDGTVDVYRVNKTESIKGYDNNRSYIDYHRIKSESLKGTYTIPSGCSLIFSEAQTWIEGTVSQKTTVAAANTTNPSWNPSIIIADDIEYTAYDGSVGMTVIAEEDILIPWNSPDHLDINGVYIAQNGMFGRHLYPCWEAPWDQRTTLDRNGTIVSAKTPRTYWEYHESSCGNTWSGYDGGSSSYDKNLAKDPPPLTPFADDEYEYIEWEEPE